jgi:hypothetical protein
MRNKLAAGGVAVVVGFLLATNPVVVNAAGQITSGMIKNGTIKSVDVKNNNLKGKDVKDNSLTGADILEATLAGVNASTLNGQPPSAYQNTSYRFRLPVTAASTDKSFNLAVPAGNYLATYAVIATTAGPIRCIISPAAGALGEAPTVSSFDGGFATATGSAILQVTTGPAVLRCFGPSFALYGGTDVTSSVSLTKIDVVNTPTATGGRSSEGGRTGGFTG